MQQTHIQLRPENRLYQLDYLSDTILPEMCTKHTCSKTNTRGYIYSNYSEMIFLLHNIKSYIIVSNYRGD